MTEVVQIDSLKNSVVMEIRGLLKRAEKGEVLTLMTVYTTYDGYTCYYRCGHPIAPEKATQVIGALEVHKGFVLRGLLQSINREPNNIDDNEKS